MDYVTVASFETSPEAHIATGRPQADGLDIHLADEHLVQSDWLDSSAVGGVKLQAAPPQAEQARRILTRDDSDQIDAED